MNISELFAKKRHWTSALVQMAVMASSFSASAASNAYYARRRGSYGAGRNQSYLVNNGLSNISDDLLWQRNSKVSVKQITCVRDVTINRAGQQDLLIVDRNIKNYRGISGLAKPGVDVVEIPQEANGLDFILKTLSSYQNLNAIRLFAHANKGNFLFGNTFVDAQGLKTHPEFIQAIDKAVKGGGDVLLYGQELANGASVVEPLQISGNEVYVPQFSGTTYTVTTNSDSGADGTIGASLAADQSDGGGLSMREALNWAQAGDQITFSTGMTISLASGELVISKGITIDGDLNNDGVPDVTIDAGYHSRVIDVTSGVVTLDGLTIQHGLLSGAGANKGQAGGSSFGAGISNAGTLTLMDVTVTHNYATGGGGAVPAGAYAGGGGGGGAGVQGIGGAPGGYTIGSSTYSGLPGGSGKGGNGGSYNGLKMNGRGGTSGAAGPGIGGGPGGYGASYRDGGAGGTATVGGISIGGGGGGSGWNGTGGAGGSAAGGVYNSGTLFVLGSSAITNNAAAGGGGGGGGTGGVGGSAGGGILNTNVGKVYMTSAAYSAMTGNAAGGGFGGFNPSHVQASSGGANAKIYNNSGIKVINYSIATLTSAAYDASTGILTVTGTDMTAGDTIDPTKLTITGEGGTTYRLTSSTVTATSSTSFSITLNAADKDAVNRMLNKNGTSSTSGTTYNLAAATNWDTSASVAADLTGNGVAASNVAVPAITSATYNASTGSLVVTGSGFLSLNGAANDIVANKFTITGDGGATYTLTDTPNPEINSGTAFTLALSSTDKGGVNAIVNKNGTSSIGGTTYNLAAAEDWAAGADPAVVTADVTGNGITASNVIIPPALTASSGSAAFVAGDNTASTPVAIDAGITVTDAGSATLASATTAITGNFYSGQDVLAFTNDGSTMGNITGSYNAATGVLSLTSSGATATLAQWQSTLRSITYTNTAISPNTPARTISFTAVDGAAISSNTATRTVTITATDQTPIVSSTGGTTSYVAGNSSVTIDGGISVSDLDNTTQSSATVSVTSGFHSGDVLGFTNDGSTMGNIVASYNAATGVLTATSAGNTATLAQWANAMRAVTFSSTSTTAGSRTISFATSDGTKSSAATTKILNVTAPPTITTDGGSAAFVAGDNTASTPVAIDAGITVTDGSATTLASATIAITGNFRSGQDVLAFTNNGSTMGNITGSYNAATGVLALTSSGGTATLAQWQSALESITYTNTAVSPNTPTRTISFTAVDGAAISSNTATRTVTITATDQTPIVSSTGGTTSYVAGNSPVTVDGGISVSDLDNATQSSATVSVTSGFHSGDVLTFTNDGSTMGNITGSYNAATGVLTLTSSGGTATNVQWANALNAATFSSSSTTTGNRTISFAVSDGTKTSAAVAQTVNWSTVVTSVAVPANNTYKLGDVLSFTINFSDNVTVTGTPQLGLTIGATSKQASYVSGSGTSALTFSYTVGSGDLDADGITIGTLSLNGGTIRAGAIDATITLNSVGSTASVNVDGVAPTLIIASDKAALKAGETATITFTFSEDPGATFTWDGSSGDVTVTGGILSAISGTGLTRTAVFTPDANTNNGTASITVSAGSYTDAAGNGGGAGTTPTLNYDSQAPSIVITSDKPQLKVGETATITFTFSEDPGATFTWDGSSGDVTVTGGILSAISGTGLTRTAVFTPDANTNNGTASITVSAGSYTDAAGNGGGAGITPSLNYDTQTPAVNAINAVDTNPTIATSVDYTVTFSEAVTGVDATDFTVTNTSRTATGTVSSVSGTGATYIVTVNNVTGAGGLRLDLNGSATGITDAAGNAISGSYTSGQSYTIGYGTPEISFSAIPDKTYGSADFVPGATSTNTGTSVTYTSSNTAVATIVSGNIHIVGAGTTTITASQGAGSGYDAAADQQQTLTVNPATLAITVDAQTKVYGTTNPALTASYSGFVNGDTPASLTTPVTLMTTATTSSAVGNYAISASGAVDANYTISYTAGNLAITPAAITVTADARSKNYGDADPALTYQITSGSLVGSDALTGSLTRDRGENVGTYAIRQGALGLSSNYNLTFAGANLTIGTRAVTVTADARSKNYGDADPALTYQITSGSLVGSDALTGSLTRDGGENVGTYAIRQGALALSSNYNLTFAGANLTIGTRAVTVTADARSKNYGDADPALTYQITSGSLVGSDALTGSLTRDGGENVGTYAIRQGALGLSSNYNLTFAGANLTIGTRAVTVTADARSKNYGDADPALTYQITSGSLIGSDAFTGSLTRDRGENVGTYAIRQGALALSNNYNLTFAGANLIINKAALSITANSLTRAYGQTNPTLTMTYTGFVNGDDASKLTAQPVITTTANSNSATGTYPIAVNGAASANYNISYVSGTLTVTAATLIVTADDQTRIYGSANPVLTAHYSGFINGDDASKLTTAPSLTTTASASSTAGDYTITASGAAMSNYNIVYQPGTMTINKAQLTVTADDQGRAFGAANPQLTISYYGFVNGDDVSKLSSTATASTIAGTNTAPGTYPITVTGAASPNYTFSYVPGTLTIAPLTDDNLSNLVVNQGRVALSPDFSPGVYSYSATVENLVDRVHVTALFASTATAQINGGLLYNNSPSNDIILHPGNNLISVIVTAQDGSQHTYTIRIYRGLPASSITATNILTPNGDGKNDTWLVKDINLYPNNTVSVYDRAGRLVYNKHDYQNDWDGTLKGSPLEQGTYYFTIDLGNGGNLIKGFITIIRE
jgi:gliding motility-associated-like protein